MELNKRTRQSGHSPVELSTTVDRVSILGAVLPCFHPSRQAGVSRYPVTRRANANQHERGFSLVELMIVVIVSVILASIAIPNFVSISRSARNTGDARAISGALNLARMRSAANFTHARVYMDLNGNTFHVEMWYKGGACWQTDGEAATSCTSSTSPVTALNTGDTFGFGSISAGPTAATSTIAQAPLCTAGVAGAAAGATTSNTACIEFNSRSFPVKSDGSIVASDAIYITNNSKYYSAVAVSISGQPAAYLYTGAAWAQF
jgi:prepilin-type N-terminal cleavage/methylation domain-containing protein